MLWGAIEDLEVASLLYGCDREAQNEVGIPSPPEPGNSSVFHTTPTNLSTSTAHCSIPASRTLCSRCSCTRLAAQMKLTLQATGVAHSLPEPFTEFSQAFEAHPLLHVTFPGAPKSRSALTHGTACSSAQPVLTTLRLEQRCWWIKGRCWKPVWTWLDACHFCLTPGF